MYKKYLLGFLFFLLLIPALFNRIPLLLPTTLYSRDKRTMSSSISPKVGQWLLYKVELTQMPPESTQDTSAKKETVSFTMKISLVGQETIHPECFRDLERNNRVVPGDNQTYFWEELDIPSMGVILKRLSNLANGKVKKCIFQRRGDQPIEFELAELSRQLGESQTHWAGMLAKLVTSPSLSFFPKVIEPTYRIVSRRETSYLFSRSRKKLQCEQTDYEGLAQTLRLSIWSSVDIPITKIVKLVVATPPDTLCRTTSIILLDFGLTGATSRITGKPVKFGGTK